MTCFSCEEPGDDIFVYASPEIARRVDACFYSKDEDRTTRSFDVPYSVQPRLLWYTTMSSGGLCRRRAMPDLYKFTNIIVKERGK